MTDANHLTEHAALRARQRLGLSSPQAETILAGLWQQGREPSPADLRQFSLIRAPGCAYRLAVYRRRLVLLVGDATTGALITLYICKGKSL